MKFCGKVGYVSTAETRPGIWEEQVTERTYRGDVGKNSTRWKNGVGVNDDIDLSSDLSIIADAYAYQHFSEIRYVKFMGAKWKVNSAVPERPRISLSLGGLYNGQQS